MSLSSIRRTGENRAMKVNSTEEYWNFGVENAGRNFFPKKLVTFSLFQRLTLIKVRICFFFTKLALKRQLKQQGLSKSSFPLTLALFEQLTMCYENNDRQNK